MVPVLNSSFA